MKRASSLIIISFLALLTGFNAKAETAVFPDGFEKLRTGFSQEKVIKLFGQPQNKTENSWSYKFKNGSTENKLILSWKNSKLASAKIHFDPALDAKRLEPRKRKFKALGPTQEPVGTLPTDMIWEDPATGQRWVVTFANKIISWWLTK